VWRPDQLARDRPQELGGGLLDRLVGVAAGMVDRLEQRLELFLDLASSTGSPQIIAGPYGGMEHCLCWWA
jgi:hypothetical protein